MTTRLRPAVWAGLAILLLAQLNVPFLRKGLSLVPLPFPLSPGRMALSLACALACFGAAAAYAFLLFAAGTRVAEWSSRRPERAFTPLVWGILAASLAVLGLGMAGLLFRSVMLVAAAAVIAASFRGRMPLPPFRIPPFRSWWPGLLLAPFLPILLAAPLLEPANVDILEYHIGAPALWTMHHRIFAFPGNPLLSMPLGMERLITPFLVFPSLRGAAPALMLILLAAASVACARAMRRTGGDLAPLAGWAVFACGQALALAVDGHPDVGLVLAAALGLLAFTDGSAASLGAACALAFSCKYQGGVVAAALVGAAALFVPGMRDPRRSAVAALFWLAPCVPWLLKNAGETGNPLYPFAPGLFPSLNWTAWNSRVLWGSMENASVRVQWDWPGSLVEYATAFWRGMHTPWFAPAACAIYAAPVLAFHRGAAPAARAAAAAALALSLVWMVPLPQIGRFLLPAAVLALWALLSGGAGSVARGALALLVLGGGFELAGRTGGPAVRPGAVLFGSATPAAYARAALGEYVTAAAWAGTGGPADGRVLVIGQGYGYGMRRPWIASNEVGIPAFLLAVGLNAASPGRMRIRLRQAGVRWILYNPMRALNRSGYFSGLPLGEKWLISWAEMWRFWVDAGCGPQREDETGVWHLFALRASPAPRPVAHSWLPGAENLIDAEHLVSRGTPNLGLLASQRRVMGDFGISLFQRAVEMHSTRNDAAGAARLAERAMKTGLASAEAYNALAYFLEGAGRTRDAVRWYGRARDLNPDDARARDGLDRLRRR